MGFFKAMGNIVAGKPVFGADNASPPADMPSQPSGPKQIPRLSFGRIENHQQNDRLEIFADARNDFSEPTLLDDVALNGVRRSIDVTLRPGETRQVLVYAGAAFRQPPGGYLEVRYRKERDGDYFLGYYQSRCSQVSDGTYTVSEFRSNGQVKDI